MKEGRRRVETEGPLLTTGPEMELGMDGLQEDPLSDSRAASLLSPCFLMPNSSTI